MTTQAALQRSGAVQSRAIDNYWKTYEYNHESFSSSPSNPAGSFFAPSDEEDIFLLNNNRLQQAQQQQQQQGKQSMVLTRRKRANPERKIRFHDEVEGESDQYDNGANNKTNANPKQQQRQQAPPRSTVGNNNSSRRYRPPDIATGQGAVGGLTGGTGQQQLLRPPKTAVFSFTYPPEDEDVFQDEDFVQTKMQILTGRVDSSSSGTSSRFDAVVSAASGPFSRYLVPPRPRLRLSTSADGNGHLPRQHPLSCPRVPLRRERVIDMIAMENDEMQNKEKKNEEDNDVDDKQQSFYQLIEEEQRDYNGPLLEESECSERHYIEAALDLFDEAQKNIAFTSGYKLVRAFKDDSRMQIAIPVPKLADDDNDDGSRAAAASLVAGGGPASASASSSFASCLAARRQQREDINNLFFFSESGLDGGEADGTAADQGRFFDMASSSSPTVRRIANGGGSAKLSAVAFSDNKSELLVRGIRFVEANPETPTGSKLTDTLGRVERELVACFRRILTSCETRSEGVDALEHELKLLKRWNEKRKQGKLPPPPLPASSSASSSFSSASTTTATATSAVVPQLELQQKQTAPTRLKKASTTAAAGFFGSKAPVVEPAPEPVEVPPSGPAAVATGGRGFRTAIDQLQQDQQQRAQMNPLDQALQGRTAVDPQFIMPPVLAPLQLSCDPSYVARMLAQAVMRGVRELTGIVLRVVEQRCNMMAQSGFNALDEVLSQLSSGKPQLVVATSLHWEEVRKMRARLRKLSRLRLLCEAITTMDRFLSRNDSELEQLVFQAPETLSDVADLAEFASGRLSFEAEMKTAVAGGPRGAIAVLAKLLSRPTLLETDKERSKKEKKGRFLMIIGRTPDLCVC